MWVTGLEAFGIADQIDGDGVEPIGEFSAGLELGAFFKDADKGILGDVLGVGFTTGQPDQPMQQAGLMPLHERIQGLAAALAQAGHVGSVSGVISQGGAVAHHGPVNPSKSGW